MVGVGFELRQSGFKDLALNSHMILLPVKRPSIHLSTPSSFPSASQPTQPPIYPSIYPTIQPLVHSTILPPSHLSTQPSTHPSIHLFPEPLDKTSTQPTIYHQSKDHLLSTSCVLSIGTVNKPHMLLILLEISVYKKRSTWKMNLRGWVGVSQGA